MAEDRDHRTTMKPILLNMTDGAFSRGPLVLTDQAAASFVTQPSSARYFLPFLGREASASAVAASLGVDIGSVTYRIRRMLELGLVLCTRVEPRAGRAVRYYRSTADAVFAPLELTPVGSLASLFRVARRDSAAELERCLEAAWLRLGREQSWGTHLYRLPNGYVNRDFVPRRLLDDEKFWPAVLADSAPVVWDQYAELNLTREAAKRLQLQLSGLIASYARESEEGSRPTSRYICHLAVAPSSVPKGV
jgi:hypothetical protein